MGQSVARFAILSIVVAVATIALKAAAYLVTGSVGLLSDALESVVNLVAAVVALIALTIAARPPDEDHEHGHDKAEYFASGFEGLLIVVAACSIIVAAVERIVNPVPLDDLGIGLAISALAAVINLGTAVILLRAAKRYSSIALEADGKHLLTDVITSVGVILAVGAVAVTGWLLIDPLIALVVAANILWTGARLIWQSVCGLMDTVLPSHDRVKIAAVLDRFRSENVQWHALRTRQSGSRRFVQVHLLVPGSWTVQQGHDLAERVEADIRNVIPRCNVLTHVEPVEDPLSWADVPLDRPESARSK
ncbi:MAG: cation diffusion facilitator family transporter [Chloroflexota bacterium]|nr:cation diffusion facilitator family transporter [Dehalococcoidia bacterium]MDW8254247.1 cation diffusion facilitator family transporter [Chloroflexota bacterium]